MSLPTFVTGKKVIMHIALTLWTKSHSDVSNYRPQTHLSVACCCLFYIQMLQQKY